MNRFEFALYASAGPQNVRLVDLAQQFLDAVVQAVAEDVDPLTDPAIIVLGSFIAFHCHADVNTAVGYQELLMLCAQGADDRKELQ